MEPSSRSSLTFPARWRSVRPAGIFGVLSKQADEEVDAAEAAVAQPGQPGPQKRMPGDD